MGQIIYSISVYPDGEINLKIFLNQIDQCISCFYGLGFLKTSLSVFRIKYALEKSDEPFMCKFVDWHCFSRLLKYPRSKLGDGKFHCSHSIMTVPIQFSSNVRRKSVQVYENGMAQVLLSLKFKFQPESNWKPTEM